VAAPGHVRNRLVITNQRSDVLPLRDTPKQGIDAEHG
jgi:hypothetical protein